MTKVAEFPDAETLDPLAKMSVYRLCYKLRPAALEDAEIIRLNPITEKAAGQLYTAVGSIPANVVEGYSRSSGRDRARIFDYALGSARESIEWYESSRHMLEPEIFADRLAVLNEIAGLLLAVIPRERVRTIKPLK